MLSSLLYPKVALLLGMAFLMALAYPHPSYKARPPLWKLLSGPAARRTWYVSTRRLRHKRKLMRLLPLLQRQLTISQGGLGRHQFEVFTTHIGAAPTQAHMYLPSRVPLHVDSLSMK